MDISTISTAKEVIGIVLPVFKKFYKTKKWNDLFVGIGEDLRNLEHEEGELFDQICKLFSEENLRLIAKSNRSAGFELLEQVENELVNFFKNNEIYSVERQHYISLFMENLKNSLKNDFPEEYDRAFLKEFRNENEQDHLKIANAVDEISNKIDELMTKDLNIKTCKELNNWYISNTRNGCSLELFNHENETFAAKLLDQLSNGTIYIKGENVFETVAYIAYLMINDVRFIRYKKSLIIVEDEKSWNDLRNIGLSGCIFINRFNNSENLELIDNNKCLFVHGKNDYSKSKDFIDLEKRFFRNLVDKITQCGFEHSEAIDISSASRNNYTILMRSLFLGKQKEPSWTELKEINTLLPAMVANQWLDKDAVFFDLILDNNEKYIDYLKKISEINDEQDPFFVVHTTRFNNKKYMIADPEDVWDYFGDSVDESFFEKIEPMIELIMGEIDPKFELPNEKHYYARVLGYVPQFSDELKNGFLESLIYLSRSESKISHLIKQKIRKSLENVNSKKEWFSISEILPLIFEIDPDAVLSKFEEELKRDNSGLINLFVDKSDDFFTGRSYYTHVIWTLEKALYLEKYIFRTIAILSKLMELDIEYKMANSPLNTLHNALVAWCHHYVYSIKEKIQFVKYIVENNTKGWLLLKKLLPSSNTGYISNLNSPNYTDYLLSDELKNRKQVYDTYLEYCHLAIANIGGNIDNLCALYEESLMFDFGMYDILKEKTFELLNGFSDLEKYKLYKKIYNLISRNRHFQNTDWAQSIENLKLLEEEILNKITFNDESFRYQYIFESYNDISLNPVVYEKDDEDRNSFEENQKLDNELRVGAIRKLIELNVNWSEFFDRLSPKSPYYIGMYLADVRNDTPFIEELSGILFKGNRLSILSAYYASLNSKFGVGIIDTFVNSGILNDRQYLELLFSGMTIDIETAEFLDAFDEGYKEVFWKSTNNAHLIKEEAKNLAFENCLKYQNSNILIELADRYHYPTESLIEVLETIKKVDFTPNQMTSYHVERIFKKIYSDNFPKAEIASRVMNLEIYFINIVEKKSGLRYLKHNLSYNPGFSAELIKYSYKKENRKIDERLDDNKKNIAEIAHKILFSLKFSPTNDGEGEIIFEKLHSWCSEYISYVKENEQKKVGMTYLGHFLANTNVLNDSEFPQESVKRVIEEVFCDELLSGFSVEIYNRLGVRNISDGSDLLELSNRYNGFAQKSRMYPKTQKILDSISRSFFRDYESEKASAKYEH